MRVLFRIGLFSRCASGYQGLTTIMPTKHSLAPWRVEPLKNGFGIYDPKGNLLAKIDVDGEVSRPRREMDARVMAAGSALLQLARDVLHETGEDEEGLMPHEPREALLLLRQKALALVALVEP